MESSESDFFLDGKLIAGNAFEAQILGSQLGAPDELHLVSAKVVVGNKEVQCQDVLALTFPLPEIPRITSARPVPEPCPACKAVVVADEHKRGRCGPGKLYCWGPPVGAVIGCYLGGCFGGGLNKSPTVLIRNGP